MSKKPQKPQKTKAANIKFDDEEEQNTMYDFIVGYLHKFYVENIPVAFFNEMSPSYMYYFGSIAYMAAIASFVYFAYTNYNQAVSTAFISLDEGSGICNTVSIPITNTYLADSAGNWQGSPAFTYSRAMYSLTLNAFQVESTAQYVDMMETFQQSLQYIGQVMRGQDLALNMIYWIGYVKYYSVQYPTATNFSDIGYGNLQYLQLTGDALQIFDLSYLQARMASVSGTCHVASFTAYDRSDGLLMLHMNSTEFVHDDICMDTVLPQNIGYVAVLDDTNFNIPLEVRSFSIAVAVNVGIMDVSNLGAAGYSILPFEYQSVNYTFGQYFDIRYPTMKTVYCIVNQSAVPPPAEDGTLQGIKQLCFYALGNTLGLPVINSFGNSSANPVRCDCTKPVGYSSYCNIVNLIPSLVFYKYDGTVQYDLTDIKKTMQQLGLFNLLKLYFNYPSYEDLNVAAYEATFAAVAEAYGKMDPLLKTSSWLKNAYKFCSIGKQTCSILAYNVYSPEEHSISTYKYQLLNGSCTDSITISNTDWENLETPPATLTQSYYECYQPYYEAMLDAFGIATGNTQLAVPAAVIVLLPLLYLILISLKQLPPKEEYLATEKAQASEILALVLLRLRDGKTRGINPNGVLMKLCKELIDAAKEEGGYPDSDDEDDYQENKDVVEEIKLPVQRVERNKMAVFTRQIDAEITAKQMVASSNTRPKSISGTAAIGGQLTNSNTTENKTNNVESDNSWSSLYGFSSYLFGSSVETKMEQELVDMKGQNPIHGGSSEEAVVIEDANNNEYIGTAGIVILNSNDDHHETKNSKKRKKKNLSAEDFDVIVEDLVRLFSEAVVGQKVSEDFNSDDEDQPVPAVKESREYRQAIALAKKLVTVSFNEIVDRSDRSIFVKLSNALCMHASIEMGKDMREIAMNFGETIAYNVGGKVLTSGQMANLL